MPIYDMTTGKRIDILPASFGGQLVMTFDEETGDIDCVEEKLPEKIPEFSYEDLKKWGQSKPKEVKTTPKKITPKITAKATRQEKTGKTDCAEEKLGESKPEEVKTPKWTPKNKKKKKNPNKWL